MGALGEEGVDGEGEGDEELEPAFLDVPARELDAFVFLSPAAHAARPTNPRGGAALPLRPPAFPAPARGARAGISETDEAGGRVAEVIPRPKKKKGKKKKVKGPKAVMARLDKVGQSNSTGHEPKGARAPPERSADAMDTPANALTGRCPRTTW